MDLIVVIPVPNATPKTVTIKSPGHVEPSDGPRQRNWIKGNSPVANYCDEVYLSNVIAPNKSHQE